MHSADILRYPQLLDQLPKQPKTWPIKDVVGLIGPNFLEHLASRRVRF